MKFARGLLRRSFISTGKGYPSVLSNPTDNYSAGANLAKYWPWVSVTIIVIFVAAIRIRLLEIPLERDEGEFAYMGQLMLQGIPPYQLAYNMKLPGIYAAYALVMAVFGQTIAGIHLGLMVVNAIAIVLLFLLTRRVHDDVAGVAAAASYALLSLSPSVLGTSAHATQFIVPFALGGTLLLLRALDSGKYRMLFASGLLYGLAFLMKQHAIFFIAFAAIYFFWSILRIRPVDLKRFACGLVFLIVGSVTPVIVTCVVLYTAGVFPKFWFWTFAYGSKYVSQVPLSYALHNLMFLAPRAINPWGPLWVIAGIGLTAVFWNGKARSNWFFGVGTALFSFLTVCPGFIFRNHYFVTLLPAVALLAGVGVSSMRQFLSERKMPYPVQVSWVLIIAATMVGPILLLGRFFFIASPVEACRMMYGENPFPESIEIADYIRNHSLEDDKIAVIGSEPQIYFYSNRKSATGYIYVYGLMELQDYAFKMQIEMMGEIEKARPKHVVFVDIPASWLVKTYSDRTILRWAQKYLGSYYRTVGIVDIFPDRDSQAYWDDEARGKQPQSQYSVYVLERRDD